mgnify:FL=1
MLDKYNRRLYHVLMDMTVLNLRKNDIILLTSAAYNSIGKVVYNFINLSNLTTVSLSAHGAEILISELPIK